MYIPLTVVTLYLDLHSLVSLITQTLHSINQIPLLLAALLYSII